MCHNKENANVSGGESIAENELSKNRLLYMYTKLTEGKTIYKKEAAQQFSCSLRSIQRDIDDLRAFFTNQSEINGIVQELEYDRKVDGYRLVPPTRNMLSNEEVFGKGIDMWLRSQGDLVERVE